MNACLLAIAIGTAIALGSGQHKSQSLVPAVPPASDPGATSLNNEPGTISVDQFPSVVVGEMTAREGVILDALASRVIRQHVVLWRGGIPALYETLAQPHEGDKEAVLQQRVEDLERQLGEAQLNMSALLSPRSPLDGPYTIRNYVCDARGVLHERVLSSGVDILPLGPN